MYRLVITTGLAKEMSIETAEKAGEILIQTQCNDYELLS
jgi:hypothetical protein